MNSANASRVGPQREAGRSGPSVVLPLAANRIVEWLAMRVDCMLASDLGVSDSWDYNKFLPVFADVSVFSTSFGASRFLESSLWLSCTSFVHRLSTCCSEPAVTLNTQRGSLQLAHTRSQRAITPAQ